MVERAGGRGAKAQLGEGAASGTPARPRASGASAASSRGSSKSADKKVIALVYDFDGTLSPRPMQEYAFLPKLGIEPREFWAECTRVSKAERADALITYMHLLYKKAKEKNVRIDRADLVAQGKKVELYPGVAAWFDQMHAYVKKRGGEAGITVKHYLVSSGLTEIIEGTKIYPHFANVFASEYWFDAYEVPFPKRVISDTGKTQFLFRINKGIEDLGESINAHMPEDERPIPFSNFIYFGDGDTDVPSMALLKKNGGHAIAVHDPGESKEKCIELFKAGRCDFYATADYRKGSDLFKRTCLLLDRIIADVRVKEEARGLG
ncbi:HAD family hydrolase [Hyphomicrobium sp.]|uniref:HAD family hydrolase n=1 Tax=Hyphomicrobium sp. TaxID=82 RepID=UPI002D78D9F7|nr:HAD family hydrolase [Hyphomicrobium sp.]HET6388631.1 HAD family hydrolase [Hyphomicrobium sp.]